MYILILHRFRVITVLIETLWNVNEEFLREYVKCDLVLIETLWNVN